MARQWRTMIGLLAVWAVALVPAVALGGPGTGTAQAAQAKARRYIVVMAANPVAVTAGPNNLRSPSARTRAADLVSGQDTALRAIGKQPGDKVYSYTMGLNGFAVDLTEAQVAQLEHRKDIARVLPDLLRKKTTDASPKFLGLSGPGGVWAKGWTGENVVVGVIDTGIWPEHPSFADNGSYAAAPITLEDTPENRACNFGNTAANPNDKPFTCNHKLIGAREFLTTYKQATGLAADEYDSARDDDGHGSHTASTSAGNANVAAQIFGVSRGTVSGIAPRARIVAYKALGNQGGYTSDLVAAIDQAVADGVNVINYSVGGGAALTGGDDIAYLFASAAGVFVATSAGNDGPGDGTIGGPASVPWVTTVGASTQPRFFQGSLILGNGKTIVGSSATKGTVPLKLVDGAAAGSEACEIDKLDPAKVKGATVLCLRGVNGRAAKSYAVYQAGGAGMVLYNTDDVDNLFTDNFWVPTVMLDHTPGLAVKDYIASTAQPTGKIVYNQRSTWPSAPSMAIFSSRGPDPVAEDIIKPDVTAPGVQILAAASPTPDSGAEGGEAPGQLFMSIAGTSMSSPHVAGLLALVKQAHPDWTPAMAKSALMTTAYQNVKDNDRVSRATPFAMGSGHVDPAGQKGGGTPFDPGLVYDAGFDQYLGFLCDADPSVFGDPAATCSGLADAGVPTTAVNLNYPSIGIQAVPGSATVQRTVTRAARPGVASNAALVFKPVVVAPPGYKVTVTPSQLRLAPGQSATFSVKVTNVSAANGSWKFGSLTWKATGYDVYSPIAVKGVALKAPTTVTGSGASGSVQIPVTFGYSGTYSAKASGLTPATVATSTVQQDPDQTFDPADGFSDSHQLTVSGASLLRVALPPDSVSDPSAVDLDLYVVGPNGDVVAQSTAGGTDEKVEIPNPADGTYTVYVHGWAANPSADYTLYSWIVPTSPGSLSISSAPASATSGTTGTVTGAWTGADGTWNFGTVSHSDSSGELAQTVVEVDNRP